jgi:hypothetical protein
LLLQPQDFLSDVSWPTHAVIAVPRGSIKPTDQLFILENDRPIVAQVEVAARWPDGSPKWLHAYASFRYIDGKPAKYAMTNDDKPPANVLKSPLTVADDASGIRINTGVVTLFIPRPFSGITMAKYGEETVLDGPGGPSLVDDRGILWHAMHDDKAEVIVEQQGPAQVTVKASGWYQTAERRVEPFCRFVTRITAFAGSPIIKFDHATIFADDMRKHAIAELAFKFSLPGAKRFSSGTLSGRFRDDLTAIWFAQVSANRLVALAQYGVAGAKPPIATAANVRSPGWFSAELTAQQVVLLTKDFWKKCPKEVKIAPDEIIYYAWPKHGELATPDATATRPEGVYKFQCFLTGRLLDSRLPSEYFSALEAQTDTTECKAVYARAANMEGVAIHNEFALAFVPAAANRRRDNPYLEGLQKLYAQSPLATVGPAAVAASGVLGHVAPSGTEFPDVQLAVREGMLGYARSIERYGDYGWCIYGNTHSSEFMNPAAAGVPAGRPSLHRVWDNNHYQHVSTSWRLFALDGDPRLLDWARIATDNYASIGQVRHDGLRGYVDGNNEHKPGTDVKWHKPGAFWHCKAFVPWGCRGYGMDINDGDSGLTGHWPDPSGLLFAWLFDANRWAKDGYELWLKNVEFPASGNRREVNTTFVHAITAYEYQPRPEVLAAIKGMAHGLTREPLAQQHPGAMFEPTWLSRYHELFPDDAEFNKYIIDSADSVGVGVDGYWSLALSATAYEITKKEAYLRQHAGTLARSVRRIFHDPQADKRWDMYGFSPGPQDGQFMLQWHRFAAALRDAHIASLKAPDEPGTYLCGAARFDNRDDITARGIKILVWRESQSASLDLQANTIGGGDIHPASLRLLSPKRQALLNISRLAVSTEAGSRVRSVRPSTWEGAVENHAFPEGDSGLYTVLIGGQRIGIYQPLTRHPECQVLRNSKLNDSPDPNPLFAILARGYLVPLTTGKVQLTFSAGGPSDGSYISLHDLQGKPIMARYLRAGESVSATMNEPGGPQGPWLLDAFSDCTGFFKLTIVSNLIEPLLFGRRLEDVQLIRQKLGK